MRHFSLLSRGTGRFLPDQLKRLGEQVVFEEGVLVWHPETISIGSRVYIGHGVFLKGYYNSEMVIGNDVYIGARCLLHSPGGIIIEDNVGLSFDVRIVTSHHPEHAGVAHIHSPSLPSPVVLREGCLICTGAIICPGVTVGRNAIVGAGVVVVSDVPDDVLAVGVPARAVRRVEGGLP